MKKILIFALAAIVAHAAFGQSDANQMKYLQILAPTASAATTSAVFNVAAYKGNATLAVQFAPATEAVTSTVTFVHAAASTGVYATVTNTAGSACVITQTGPATNVIQTVSIDTARLRPYLKAIVAQATTNEIPAVSALFIAPMKAE